MRLPAELVPISFSLASALSWGTSDSVGGYAARRADAFLLTVIAHGSGLLLMTALVLANHSPYLPNDRAAWGIAGGLPGGAATAMFYRALAAERIGLTAPVAVLGAASPTVFSLFTEGIPSVVQIAGFDLAGSGTLLISRSEDSIRPDGVGLALLAGMGFAGFYLCMKQSGDGSAVWAASSDWVL